jgi:hypothetical protein
MPGMALVKYLNNPARGLSWPGLSSTRWNFEKGRCEMRNEMKEVLESILQVHKAFGAPGDYGYDTKEGKALIRLYQAHAALEKVLSVYDPASCEARCGRSELECNQADCPYDDGADMGPG